MNKSALYLFSVNAQEQKICFRSPYYGDPEQVVDRFFNMHSHWAFDKGYAIEFFKANPELEFARDHNVISDYIYALDHTGKLRVSSYVVNTRWEPLFEGSWHCFANQYGSQEFLHLFREEPGSNRTRIMTLNQAKKFVQHLREPLEIQVGAIERNQQADFIGLQIKQIQSGE